MTLPSLQGNKSITPSVGGALAHHGFYGGAGSLSVPLTQQFGFQADGLVSSYRGDLLAGVGGHAFWRDPSSGLLGVYGDYLHWDRLGSEVGHVGVEGALYWGRFTWEGVVGVESRNNRTAVINGLVETVNHSTRAFDKVDLAYYLTDDVKFSIGHRYYGGKNLLALGSEWQFANFGKTSSALFIEGRVGTERLDSVCRRTVLFRTEAEIADPPSSRGRPAGKLDRWRVRIRQCGFIDIGASGTNITCPPGKILVGGVCVGL